MSNEKGRLWGVITPATPVIIPLNRIRGIESIEELPTISYRRRKLLDRLYPVEKNSKKGIQFMKTSRTIVFPKVITNLIRQFGHYAIKSPIHGLRYISEERSWFERILWFMIIVISFASCIYSMSYMYMNYLHNPVIVTFSVSNKEVFEFPFPAVTICPPTKVQGNKNNFDELSLKKQQNENLTEEEMKWYQCIYLLCDNNDIERLLLETENFDRHIDEKHFFDVITELAPKNKDVFYKCRYSLANLTDCNKMFTPIIVDSGVCYTFNMVHYRHIFHDNITHLWQRFLAMPPEKTDWDVNHSTYFNDDLTADMMDDEYYPRRAFLSGIPNGLSLVLKHDKDPVDMECRDHLLGFKILLHNPEEMPRLSDKFTAIEIGSSNILAVSPTLMTTSAGAMATDHSTRKCYTATEKHLVHYRSYSYSNCIQECHAFDYINQCHCVKFSWPRANDTKICGGSSYKCIKKADRDRQANSIKNSLNAYKVDESCGCLPSCNQLSYGIVRTHSRWESYKYRADTDAIDKNITMTKVLIYYRQDSFPARKRSAIYTKMDVLARVGGLLNLFTGTSIMSLAEIIYYFTLRLYFNKHLFGGWSQETDSPFR